MKKRLPKRLDAKKAPDRLALKVVRTGVKAGILRKRAARAMRID